MLNMCQVLVTVAPKSTSMVDYFTDHVIWFKAIWLSQSPSWNESMKSRDLWVMGHSPGIG